MLQISAEELGKPELPVVADRDGSVAVGADGVVSDVPQTPEEDRERCEEYHDDDALEVGAVTNMGLRGRLGCVAELVGEGKRAFIEGIELRKLSTFLEERCGLVK